MNQAIMWAPFAADSMVVRGDGQKEEDRRRPDIEGAQTSPPGPKALTPQPPLPAGEGEQKQEKRPRTETRRHKGHDIDERSADNRQE